MIRPRSFSSRSPARTAVPSSASFPCIPNHSPSARWQYLGQRRPVADSDKQLGGYFMFERNDLDEAAEWAARIPDEARGVIELRPIIPTSGRRLRHSWERSPLDR
jgi:hypothetical protein